MSDPYERLAMHYDELRRLDPSGWPALVAERCAAEDETFRASLLRMLQNGLGHAAAPTDLGAVGGACERDGTPLPKRIGRYDVLRRLGEGGTGTVYLVRDRELGRDVALKLRRAGPSTASPGRRGEGRDPPALTRLSREASVTGRLQHPGVLPVYERSFHGDDRGTDGDDLEYFTMRPLRDSEPLLRVVLDRRRGSRFEDRRDLLEVFCQLCDTVEFAHLEGWAHGDLKPDNVAVGPHGKVVVLDWGHAQPLRPDPDGRDGRDAEGAVGGTPGYLAPELVDGTAAHANVATDVYALGVILFELLTGARPTSGPAHAPVAAVRVVRPPPPAAVLDATVPSPLAALAERALSPSPTRRPGSPAELADAVRRWQVGDERARGARERLAEAEAAVARSEATTGEARRVWVDDARARLLALGGDGIGRDLETRLARVAATADDEARRDTRRRIRRTVVAGVATVAALAGAVIVALLVERGTVADARDRNAGLLRDLEQLADVGTVDDLLGSADELWPATADAVPRMEAWLRRADEVLRRRDAHAEARAALRRTGRPVATPTRPTDDDARSRDEMRLDLADLDTALERWEGPTPHVHNRSYLTDRRDRVAAQLKAGVAPDAEGWAYPRHEDQWRDAVLGVILRGLARIDGDATAPGLRDRMRSRLETARRQHAAAALDDAGWRRAIARIQASPSYARTLDRPDPALTPLGPDPASGLEEFAVEGTGSVPRRDPANGSLTPTEDGAIVLVLVPGGTFRRGSPDSGAPGASVPADVDALRADEHPARDVRVGPFYLAKYELTQGQWARLTEGDRPSHEQGAASGFTERHPVEMVPWTRATLWLDRYGLRLPREAEWEYACRAGSGGERYVADVGQLSRHANFADATLARARAEEIACVLDQDDGHHFHAPVGSYLANPFGFHDLYGNVSEWCRDVMDPIYYAYSRPVDPPGSTARYPVCERIHRGGNWADLPQFLRSADRRGLREDRSSRTVGLRPARDV